MPSQNTGLQLDEFAAQIRSIDCAVSLEQWRDMNAISSPKKRTQAFAALSERDMNALDAIESACEAELDRLRETYSKSSVFSVVSKYRRFLDSQGFKHHPVMFFFKLTRSEYGNRRGAYKRKVAREMSELRPLFDWEGYIDRAAWLLKSDSYINVAMGLCAVTGRRPGEILATAHFEKTGDFTATFTGQLKTKDSDNARDHYGIYLLISTDVVIDALAHLRTMKQFDPAKAKPEETTGQMINRLTANAQRKCVRRYFLEFAPDYERSNGKPESLKAYNLRPIYSLLAWEMWGHDWLEANGAVDAKDTTFYAAMLGHSENDTATAQSYHDFTNQYIDLKNPLATGQVISANDLKDINHA